MGSKGNSNDNDNFGNALGLFSIFLGYENLMENRQQSADNDIAKHNQQQAKVILDDLHDQFNLQNEMLKEQTNLLNEILNILKGENKNEL